MSNSGKRQIYQGKSDSMWVARHDDFKFYNWKRLGKKKKDCRGVLFFQFQNVNYTKNASTVAVGWKLPLFFLSYHWLRFVSIFFSRVVETYFRVCFKKNGYCYFWSSPRKKMTHTFHLLHACVFMEVSEGWRVCGAREGRGAWRRAVVNYLKQVETKK